MNLDNFPFDDFVKNLQGKIEMKVLIQELEVYFTIEHAELIVEIAKICIELGCVKEDISGVYLEDKGKTVHWNVRVHAKNEYGVCVPLLGRHWKSLK